MRFLLKALARTPLPLLYAYGWAVYAIVFHIFRWRRRQVASDVAQAFPEKSDAERAAIVQQSYRNLATIAVESVWGFGASADALRARVAFENPEVIDSAVAAKHSVVLLAPHFCNWEWLLLAGDATFRLPLDAVYQTLRVEAVDPGNGCCSRATRPSGCRWTRCTRRCAWRPSTGTCSRRDRASAASRSGAKTSSTN